MYFHVCNCPPDGSIEHEVADLLADQMEVSQNLSASNQEADNYGAVDMYNSSDEVMAPNVLLIINM